MCVLLGLSAGCIVAALAGESRAKPVPNVGSVAAVVGEASIPMAELEHLADPKLARVRTEEYNVKRRILEERIQELLLQEEARRRSMALAELLEAEVAAKAKPVTSEEAAAVYESTRERFANASEEEALRQISANMSSQRVAQRRVAYVNELRASSNVRVFLEPPRSAVSAAVGPSRGSEAAPVTIIEFTDFQCPFCARSTPTLRAIEEKFGQKVRVVFRHYPLPFHKDATRAAEAAACADEQGRFWEMHDELFANQQALAPADITRHAQAAGLDPTRLNGCLASGRGGDKVKRDKAEGDRNGVTGTPTFFVNGRFVAGAASLDTFISMVDEELARPLASNSAHRN